MTKLEFLDSFKLACDALPAELIDAAIGDYEREFTDQLLSGVSEQSIVDRWGSPEHASLKLRLGTFNRNLKQIVRAEKVARVGISGFGLLVMDLFLLIPAAAYFALFFVGYVVALLIYLAGIFQSASSLAGVNYIDVPAHYFANGITMNGSTHLIIRDIDIVPLALLKEDGQDRLKKNAHSSSTYDQHLINDRGFRIVTHINQQSIWEGVGTTLIGMMMLILCFFATRLTFLKLRQFAVWHFVVLKRGW